MDIRNLAAQLVRRYETRDPFRIAFYLGYLIIHTPLIGVRGFYQHTCRCHIIYLDSELPEEEQAFVCAHELAHSFLHRHLNRVFMDTHTGMVTARFEQEADRFATELLFDDEDLRELEDFSLPTIARALGITLKLAEYRMGTVKRKGR